MTTILVERLGPCELGRSVLPGGSAPPGACALPGAGVRPGPAVPRPGVEPASRSPSPADRTSPVADAMRADRFLDPGQPFLRFGSWQAFVANDGAHAVRVVASIDPRQNADGSPVGSIGFVAADRDLGEPGMPALLRAALGAAERWLAGRGVAVVRSPVQFSTWYGHRTITGGMAGCGAAAPFPMEPAGGPDLAAGLEAAGFDVAHTAASYVVPCERWIAGAGESRERMLAAGIRDRALRPERVDDELRILHAISVAAFGASWGISEVSRDEFAAIYRPLVRIVDPELVRIAEAPDGRPIGYVFACLDQRSTPGMAGGRLIVKSVAVLPDARRELHGVGTGLTVAVHRAAAARGSTVAVHACVADGAYSQRVSARWGERCRTYATYEKVLP